MGKWKIFQSLTTDKFSFFFIPSPNDGTKKDRVILNKIREE